MKKFSEMSFGVRLGLVAAAAAAIVLVGEFLYFPLASGTTASGAAASSLSDMASVNDKLAADVAQLSAENEKIKPFEAKFKQIRVENEQLEVQLASLRNIVPEDKDADSFIKMVQDAGVQSGVNIRSFQARPTVQKEFYSEMPFQLSIDGSFYNVLSFFDRMSKLGRISNVSDLAMGPTNRGVRGARSGYKYAPSETVIASCTTTTFYTRETAPATPAKK